jgi:hypothetical protein
MTKLIDNFKQQPTYLKIAIGLSLIALIVSLTQPAFYIDRKEDSNAYSDSLTLFFLGWMSFLGGALIPFIIWLANPLYFISIILTIRNKSLGLYFSLGATFLAFLFSQLKTIMTSESGSSSVITGRGVGFKLWFISFTILTLGLIVNRIMTFQNKKNITVMGCP